MPNWELDSDTSADLDTVLSTITSLSDLSVSALITELQQEQRRRRLAAGDIDERIEEKFATGFKGRGLCAVPWIEDGVLWCPGEIIATSQSAHICQFVALGDEGWCYESDLKLGEVIKYKDKGGQQSLTACEYHDGLEVVVVEMKASMGNHSMQKARTYKIVGDDLEYVGHRKAQPNSLHSH